MKGEKGLPGPAGPRVSPLKFKTNQIAITLDHNTTFLG